MGVYIGGGKDYSAMRGPCPEGFHIPSHIEWQNLKNLLTRAQIIGSSSPWGIDSYNVLKTALKLPMTGVRNRSGTYTTNNYYWGCDGRTSSGGVQYGYLLHYNTSNFSPSSGQYRSYGCPIRPFSDNPINPMDGELLKEDWEYLDGSTMMGNVCARNPTLGVISVVYNGSQVITIADKNLGATTTYERNIYDESAVEPTLSEANCGKFYQWGNNYGFAYSGSLTTSSTQLDASSYGPGNYYSSSTFITPSSSPYDWSSVQNDNLWGGVTGVVSPAPLKNAYIGEYEFETKYQEVEYIQSSGTQRIDTGLKPTDATFGFKGKVNMTAASGDWNIISINGTSTTDYVYRYSVQGSGTQWQTSNIMTSPSGWANVGTVATGTDYEFSYNYNSDKKFTVNGTDLKTGLTASTYSSYGVNWNIFCAAAGTGSGSYSRYGSFKLYYMQIYQGTILVRDFIPCYRISDGEIGLYDLVNDVFYTNAGTGTFTKGPDVN